ncbi:Glycosyl transferase, family 31 [Dillenia turbinata]|uniref:Hexosyltransferase n=1 Tax=Dillenia turbinata TaxID=194707 RepID=A0AAN8W9D2_9MAGN
MKPTKKRFILTSIIFIISLCILASIFDIRFNSLNSLRNYAIHKNSFSKQFTSSLQNINFFKATSTDEIRILIGIYALPDQYHKRHFLRLVYGTQFPILGAKIDIKFIFCNLTKEDQKVLVALEIMQYNDVVILNCEENINEGKTYTYFSSLPEMLNSSSESYPPYHYVMKIDDDSYFCLENLVHSLQPLSREDLYYGFVIPCRSMDPFADYMSGMGYLVSWDIVEWIRESEIPKNNLVGPEDKVFGDWIREGNRGKSRFNAKWSMYNYPEPPTVCTHELWPDTIAVHGLKYQERWIHTLKYFNATANLKPSKLYHIP